MEIAELFKDGNLFQAISTIVTGMGIYILKDLKKSVDRAQMSVSELNKTVGILVERDEHNKERIANNKYLIKKNEQDIHSIRNKIHDLGNDMHKIEVINIKLDELNKKVG